jgi:hypothetical protein
MMPEPAIVGALLLDGDACIAGCLDVGLQPDHFEDRRLGVIYAAALRCFDAQATITPVTVSSILDAAGDLAKVGGPERLLELLAATTSTIHTRYYAQIVIRKFVASTMQATLKRAAEELSTASMLDDTDMRGVLERIGVASARAAEPLNRQRQAEVVQSSSLIATQTDWLWHPYLPISKLSLLEGDPGKGKTFLALTLAACVSRGWPLPDHTGAPTQATEPGNVLYMTAEDGLADTVATRLENAGADRSRIYHITGIKTSGRIEPVYFYDRIEIEAVLKDIKPSLVIWDPMQAFLGSQVDMSRANETRPLLTAVAQMAEAHRHACVIVRHYVKGAGSAINKGMGGMDIAGAARSILAVGEHPDDPKMRVMAHTKASLGETGASIAFALMPPGKLEWCGVADATAEDVASGPAQNDREERGATKEAREFLLSELALGPVEMKIIDAKAKEHGIAASTLRRARHALKCSKDRLGSGPWTLALPRRVAVESVPL